MADNQEEEILFVRANFRFAKLQTAAAPCRGLSSDSFFGVVYREAAISIVGRMKNVANFETADHIKQPEQPTFDVDQLNSGLKDGVKGRDTTPPGAVDTRLADGSVSRAYVDKDGNNITELTRDGKNIYSITVDPRSGTVEATYPDGTTAKVSEIDGRRITETHTPTGKIDRSTVLPDAIVERNGNPDVIGTIAGKGRRDLFSLGISSLQFGCIRYCGC
jgi:hypothetical protein